jgi:hypothetical protein
VGRKYLSNSTFEYTRSFSSFVNVMRYIGTC